MARAAGVVGMAANEVAHSRAQTQIVKQNALDTVSNIHAEAQRAYGNLHDEASAVIEGERQAKMAAEAAALAAQVEASNTRNVMEE